MFSVGDDRYIISGGAGEFNERGLVSSLWRLRDGRWTKLVDGLDSGGLPDQLADRRWRVTKEGLWLGAFGTGGWFVPCDDGEPRQINWSVGSPFDTIHRWFQLKDGKMLAIQFGRGGLLADAALLTAISPVQPTSKIIRASRPLLQTDGGKIFAVLRGDESALNDWDGQRWKRHRLPDNLQLWGECKIATDSKERAWLIDWAYNPDPLLRPCLIFDPANDQFHRFSNFQTALQAQASKLAGSQLGKGETFAAVFSSDGRICYEDRTWNLQYFDGREWRHWHLNEIINGGLRNSSDREPFFASDGKLSIVLNDSLWQCDELTGWKKTSAPATRPARRAAAVLPAGSPYVPDADSVVADRRGVFWVVARKRLFRVGYGLHVPCFTPSEPQPFADGRKLLEVLTDNFGNAFLRTSVQGREEYVLVPVRGQLPDTQSKVIEKSDESVTLELSTDTPKPRFAWRVDDGPWNEATTNTILRLDDLTVGKHRAQVVAIDERLQVDPTPAEIVFEVRSNPTERIGKWITQLGDKDFARREAAVATLARQPDLSLPTLRQALRQAKADQRWWLLAAIQRCEEQQRSTGKSQP